MVAEGGYLLRVDEIPVQQTGLEAACCGGLFLGRSLDASHTQRAQRVGKEAVVEQPRRSPLEQIEAVDVLDDGPVLRVLLQRRNSGELGTRVIELALAAYPDNLGASPPGQRGDAGRTWSGGLRRLTSK